MGDIKLNGVDILQGSWSHTVGLQGESGRYFTEEGSRRVNWINNSSYTSRPMTWLQSRFDKPKGQGPVAIDMT